LRQEAFAENRVGLVALAARIGERDERIGAEGHALLLPAIIVVPTPRLAAAGGDEQAEAVGVRVSTTYGNESRII
jgi:hypothetical protein